MNELALFAGAGGGILGGKLLGWRTVCAVELEPYCARRLCQRQNEGHLPPLPIWDDVRTFDGRQWCGLVDVVSGGFPCQDISVAKFGGGDGLEGERSGLWTEMARIIREVRPRYALVENSPALTSRGLGRVLGDLADMGFDARWGVLGASDCGALHQRKRIFILAYANSDRLQGREFGDQEASNEGNFNASTLHSLPLWEPDRESELPEPKAIGAPFAMAGRVDQLRAIGNGQVPRVVVAAWMALKRED